MGHKAIDCFQNPKSPKYKGDKSKAGEASNAATDTPFELLLCAHNELVCKPVEANEELGEVALSLFDGFVEADSDVEMGEVVLSAH